MSFEVVQLQAHHAAILERVLDVFGAAFGDAATYVDRRPGSAYLHGLLASDSFICLAARKEGAVIGGLAAYELKKFERERSEIYIYDLAVAEACRRQGVATAMIERLKVVARSRGADLIFVQANTAPEDGPAIALYSKLGRRQNVMHFDIEVDTSRGEAGNA